MRLRTITMLTLLAFSGCKLNEQAPPLLLVSHQPAHLARERGYIACATALYRAYPQRQKLRLKQGYKSALRSDPRVRVFHLEGTLREEKDRKEVYFICSTEPFGRTRVLEIGRLDSRLLD
jgi:hypothetical protein